MEGKSEKPCGKMECMLSKCNVSVERYAEEVPFVGCCIDCSHLSDCIRCCSVCDREREQRLLEKQYAKEHVEGTEPEKEMEEESSQETKLPTTMDKEVD